MIIQENDFRYDIILLTLILGFSILLLFSVGALVLSYVTYKSTRRNLPDYELSMKKSKSRKYKISSGRDKEAASNDDANPDHIQSNGSVPIDGSNDYPGYTDNVGFIGDDEDGTTHIKANGTVPVEDNNSIAVITQDSTYSSL